MAQLYRHYCTFLVAGDRNNIHRPVENDLIKKKKEKKKSVTEIAQEGALFLCIPQITDLYSSINPS